MNILLLEPYFTGSHKAWAEGYIRHSNHHVSILSLKGAFWKWRMHGGAVTLARLFAERSLRPDMLLASDMLDLSTFLALTRKSTANLPTVVYFHENQLTYPWSPTDRDVQKNRNHHYGFINFTSALAADCVCFNSAYHQNSFVSELQPFLRHFPDYRELNAVESIHAKSHVLPLGLDLASFDRLDPPEETLASDQGVLVLWNHRWEYDKNPEEFFRALEVMIEKGFVFQVAVLGECFSHSPAVFERARTGLGDRVVQFGFVKSREAYVRWLQRSTLLPVTSYQDFFGASVVEAMYCGALPLLPVRLAYRELIPEESAGEVFYDDFDGLIALLEKRLSGDRVEEPLKEGLRCAAGRFDWQRIAPAYDELFERVASEESNAKS